MSKVVNTQHSAWETFLIQFNSKRAITTNNQNVYTIYYTEKNKLDKHKFSRN